MLLKILDLLVPHFFVKEPIPAITNSELQKTIDIISRIPDTWKAMEYALEIIDYKYESRRFATYLFFPKIYEKDPNKVWETEGFLHCTEQNFLFRVLMVKSGHLKDEDIYLGYSFVWHISPHQYLKIKMNNKIIAIDPWNYGRGATVGKFASGFGIKTL